MTSRSILMKTLNGWFWSRSLSSVIKTVYKNVFIISYPRYFFSFHHISLYALCSILKVLGNDEKESKLAIKSSAFILQSHFSAEILFLQVSHWDTHILIQLCAGAQHCRLLQAYRQIHSKLPPWLDTGETHHVLPADSAFCTPLCPCLTRPSLPHFSCALWSPTCSITVADFLWNWLNGESVPFQCHAPGKCMSPLRRTLLQVLQQGETFCGA